MRLSQVADQAPLFSRSADAIWTDPWIARNLLKLQLDDSTDAASRVPATIDRTVDWIVPLLPPEARVLDLGCGPGRYAERLSRRGFQVTGIDINEASIDFARDSAEKEGLSIDYMHGSYLEADLKGPYDAAVCVYCDVGALTDGERDVFFDRTRSALVPGGLFVFDVFDTALAEGHTAGRTWQVCAGGDFWSERPYLLLEERTHFPEARALGNRYIVVDAENAAGIKEFTIWNRYYDEDEIRSTLSGCGFSVVRIERGLVPKNDFTSNDVLFVAARRS
jgi:SAM-dependent methyltransferase